MRTRNIRIAEELIDQLFHSNEERLAGTLLLLARHGKRGQRARAVPSTSQKTRAEGHRVVPTDPEG